MKIISIRRPTAPGADARFDLELTEQVRLNSLILAKNQDGQWRVRSPRNCGVRFASFHPSLADQITRAAVAALEGHSHAAS